MLGLLWMMGKDHWCAGVFAEHCGVSMGVKASLGVKDASAHLQEVLFVLGFGYSLHALLLVPFNSVC